MGPLPDYRSALLLATTRQQAEWQTKGLLEYVVRMMPTYEVAPHHRKITEALERVEAHIRNLPHECLRERCNRLMVFAPPQCGKTQLVSKFFPAWALGRNPNSRFILTSYAQLLADQASASVRDQLQDTRYPYAVKPYVGPAAAWIVAKHSGGVKAAGRGGAVTGWGGNYIIVDDPVSNAAEADSVTMQEQVWTWYSETIRPRLVEPGAIVLVNTRWSYRDLSGRLEDAMKEGGEQWEILSLPAIAEENDTLGRPAGSALWPARFPITFLDSQRVALGSRAFDAQYQQRPTPKGGNLIQAEWFKTIALEALPADLRWCRYWDLAISTKQSADYTASCAVAFDQKTRRLFVRDMIRGRWNWPDQKRVIKRVMNEERALGTSHAVEEALHGTALLQELQGDPDVLGIPLYGVRPHRDKVTRANPWIAMAEAGNVYLVQGSWIPAFHSECVRFPLGDHDDQIDALSGALVAFSLMPASHSQVRLGYDNTVEDDPQKMKYKDFHAYRKKRLVMAERQEALRKQREANDARRETMK